MNVSTIIKARTAGSSAAFNLEDLGQNADVWLGRVREQAARIVLAATQDAKQIRERAEVEGRKSGEQAIDKKVSQQVALQMQTVLPAVEAVSARLLESRSAWLAHWEARLVQLAARIAEKVIRRELRVQPDIPLALIRETLELAAGQPDLRLVLNPADRAALGEQVAELAARISRAKPAEVADDAAMSPGGCRLESRFGVLDNSIEAQLARIQEELS